MAASATYPVRVEAALDPPLSRWLWLVKWVLVLPHYVVLFFLWAAFAVLSVVAFVAILVTGRYPRAVFEFNVGVLRWSWRVAHYSYGALGTDRYPPFTLQEVPDYPAHLDIAYPQRLSRGLVLVKWWLLALPHYVVVAFFLGGGSWLLWREDSGWMFGTSGLIGLLVLVAAVVLLFTGAYPRPVYDFVLGMNRWVLRVAAYAGLMTDRYPPFRLDMGGHDPASPTLTMPAGPADPSPTGAPVSAQPSSWAAGQVVAVVIGALMTVTAAPLLLGGGATLWADRTQRDDAGLLTSSAVAVTTTGSALVSETAEIRLDDAASSWVAGDVVGDLRVRATAKDPARPVFVGLAPAADVDRYLVGTSYAQLRDLRDGAVATTGGPGTRLPRAPGEEQFWVARASGAGTQALQWSLDKGDWRVVVMNADATNGVDVRVDVAAEAPVLPWVAAGLLAAGVVLGLGGAALILVAVAGARRTSTRR